MFISFNSQNNIFFSVNTASPKSILAAGIYRDQAVIQSGTCSLFASDGHSLNVVDTVSINLKFNQISDCIQHTFIVTDVCCAILRNDILFNIMP